MLIISAHCSFITQDHFSFIFIIIMTLLILNMEPNGKDPHDIYVIGKRSDLIYMTRLDGYFLEPACKLNVFTYTDPLYTIMAH